jgi:outer membrane lipopolysaccharide assembly protein LptE/RlpB
LQSQACTETSDKSLAFVQNLIKTNTEYGQQIENLRRQLEEAQAKNVQAHTQLNIAKLQLDSASNPSVVLQSTYEQKEREIQSTNGVASKPQTDHDQLLDLLNNIRAELPPYLPVFEPTSDTQICAEPSNHKTKK